MSRNVTTILVKKDTLILLEKAKRILRKKSYDEVIRYALERIFDVPDDMFGVDKGRIREFTEEDRLFSEYDEHNS